MWADKVNGTFVTLAGFFIVLHCIRLIRDKKVRGVSVTSTCFFTLVGLWNLYFYPHINHFYSFFCGIWVVSANCLRVSLMIYYIRKERRVLRSLRVLAGEAFIEAKDHKKESDWYGKGCDAEM